MKCVELGEDMNKKEDTLLHAYRTTMKTKLQYLILIVYIMLTKQAASIRQCEYINETSYRFI